MSKRGFTLVEVLIVVVIMAVLAAAVIPYFGDATKDSKAAALRMNLRLLREQITVYKAQHNATPPTAGLSELTQKTDLNGTVGTGVDAIFGPYIQKIPENSFTGKAAVKAIGNDPPTAGDITANNGGGWLYNPATGGIFADHANYFTD